ncbi:MAG TPA: hypothetical protein VIL35_00615 [Vicinamibacterales bacterium]
MINFTDCLTRLTRDIVARVEPLSFIDPDRVLFFARFGRSGAEGAYATCHCLCLPEAEPGYYYWRDSLTGEITRRSEWFVPRTPTVTVGPHRQDYLISVALPRFCDQTLGHSRKAAFYEDCEPWIAKLDTVVHELYHIDPKGEGIRQMASDDGLQCGSQCHGPTFYTDVAALVRQYLATKPDRAVYEFLKYDFAQLVSRYGRVVATTFRNFPSYPQVYLDRLAEQPEEPRTRVIVPLRAPTQPRVYTQDDLMLREFSATGTQRLPHDQSTHAA